ncbi:histidine phosphatase family protein [Planomonospora corallina]|uniref:Histidine phosphatase family protein n=1 Tax=Planomonospora corallina TaxID=1806052 RepID=A0ABV8I6M9_9ACTN
MAETTVIHLLRHGEVHNPANVLYGRLPGYNLSENGRLMAETVAKSMAGRDVVALFSSPLERAQQTAAPLAETFGLEVRIDERLIEAANIFEGVSVGGGEGVFRSPRLYRHLWNPLRPSWGERYADVVQRMRGAILSARRAARGHEAVLVSHQLPIWIIRLAAEGRRLPHDPRRRQCGLASVTSLCFEDDRLASVGYSEPAAALVKRPTVPGA